MTVRAAFQPVYTKGQVLAATAVSAGVTFGKGSKALVVSNQGANVAYVRVGQVAAGGTLAATTTDYEIKAGSKETLAKAQDDNYLAYIAPAGDTTLHAIPGEGQ